MQFVSNGPDIPNSLIQAHEEGRVVFFCGAGISYPAGLPGFQGLVDYIYKELGTKPNKLEQETYSREQYDTTLNLLEQRIPGGRKKVRSALARVLKPKLRRKSATDTHTALLQLARCREGQLRLVTTNFDNIFEKVARKTKQKINSHSAPLLPIPKDSRWDGLVYLHGLIPYNASDVELNRLVFTSGDFGLAYLTERWAARFVSELFRNYVVCFVGYSINDPVMRYMMDALAADRMQGESSPPAYAFGDFALGHEESQKEEWESKGIVPVLYGVPEGSHDHSALHKSLKVWAETYRDGHLGKGHIIGRLAQIQPSSSTQQDDFVGRVLWAISDPSGLPAKQFADLNPVPSLDWLVPFSENLYRHEDLVRFGVSPREPETDNEPKFSLINRPAPYTHSSWMSLVTEQGFKQSWDSVMHQLARWLVRHLNDPALMIWIAREGGSAHNQLVTLIKDKLKYFSQLQMNSNHSELEEIRRNAPNAIPSPAMLKLWSLVLAGRVKSNWQNPTFYNWKDQLKLGGLTPTLRFQLRNLLKPMIILSEPYSWGDITNGLDETRPLKQLVNWELVLAAEDLRSSIYDISDENWQSALPELLNEFEQLLRDALDLFQELGESQVHCDRSFWDLPSISAHQQNRGYRKWVILIELLRDAWLAELSQNPERASHIARNWFNSQYPTFKRLAFFAASHDKCIEHDQWVDWVVSEDALWLWAVDTQREVMRLFVLQGGGVSEQKTRELEYAILAGPARSMLGDDIDDDRWLLLANRRIWFRLAKLIEGNGKISDAGQARFKVLSEENPNWKLAKNQSDEFSHWMSFTGDSSFEEARTVDIAPSSRQELKEWLVMSPDNRPQFYKDNWRDICRTRFFFSAYALYELSNESIWPEARWREALQVWSEDNMVLRSWKYAAPLVQIMPDELLFELAHSVSCWLKSISKSITLHESTCIDLCNRIVKLPFEKCIETDHPVGRAINHPIGHVTEVVMDLWFKRDPNDNDLLPEDIEKPFTQLCNTNIEVFRHARVMLASRLIALHRVDPHWTQNHLLPLFDWSSSTVEATAVWEGFLISPRIHPSLLHAIKDEFLQTANHYNELSEHSGQYARLLTYSALDKVDGFSTTDFQGAITSLPQDGLDEAAGVLSQAIESANDHQEAYWRNRIQPFLHELWPKSKRFLSQNISTSFARICIAAASEFPEALSQLIDFLQPIDHPNYVLHLHLESELTKNFPEESLRFLDAILKNQSWHSSELEDCLKSISAEKPELEQDQIYKKLMMYTVKRL